MENFKQNGCSQTDASRREKLSQSGNYIFQATDIPVGCWRSKKCHHYYFLAWVQDWLVRQ